MFYQFKCKAASDVMMDATVADKLLSAMGIMPHSPGIIEPAAMASAIRSLEAAIVVEARAPEPVAATEDSDEGLPPKEECVSFRQRAWPLLDMMRRAHAEGVPVTWDI
jgi:hypothetical protein